MVAKDMPRIKLGLKLHVKTNSSSDFKIVRRLFFVTIVFLLFLSRENDVVRSQEFDFENVPEGWIIERDEARSEAEVTFTDDDNELASKSIFVGEQKTGEATRYTLLLKNATGKPLKITGVKPQCGCTKVLSVPPPIAVGESSPMVITLEPTKPYFPSPQYHIELMMEGRQRPVVLLVIGNIPDAIAFTGGPEVLFRVPPTWEANLKDQEVKFELELITGKKTDRDALVVTATEELSFVQWTIVNVGNKTTIQGKCNSSEVPPDATRGTLSIFDKSSAQQNEDTKASKLDILVQVFNPSPIQFLPSPLEFTHDAKSGDWIGKGLVRFDASLIQSLGDSPEILLTSPAWGKLSSKKLGKQIYSVEIHLVPSKKSEKLVDEKVPLLPEEIKISVSVSGNEYTLTAKVEQ